jgi:ABC-type transport system substrate-binding protein
VIFTANAEYWGGAPQFDELHIKRYADSAAVKAALLDGSLDAVVGASVLEPSDEEELGREPGFDLMYGELSQNTVIIMNIANKALRKAVVHGVNKVPIIGKELNEAYEPAETLFPPSLPYCDVDLTPKFAYDSEKSEFLCGGSAAATDDADATDDKAAAGDDGAAPSDDEGGDDKGTTGDDEGTTNDRGGGSKKKKSSNKKEETLYATLFGIAAGILALLACGVCYMASKERKGEPLFAPKPASNPMRDDLEKA